MALPLLQYFINEASSGTTPTSVLDSSAGTALNATITYGAGGSYTSIGSGNGLLMPGALTNGAITATLGSTKVQTAMAGSFKGTICVVADTSVAAAGGINLSGIINNTSGTQPFEMELANSGQRLDVFWNDSLVGGSASFTAGLHVFFIVVDTTQAVATDRAVVYVDGIVVPITSAPNFPAQNTALDASVSAWGSWEWAIGVDGAVAGFKGNIFFSELYSTALTAERVIAQTNKLLANNDGSPTGPIIAVQPANATVGERQTASFSVTAGTSVGTVHCQWKLNGSNVGTDSSSYTTGTLAYSDNNSTVTCDVSDDEGTTTTRTALIIVCETPQIAWYQA